MLLPDLDLSHDRKEGFPRRDFDPAAARGWALLVPARGHDARAFFGIDDRPALPSPEGSFAAALKLRLEDLGIQFDHRLQPVKRIANFERIRPGRAIVLGRID